MDKRELDRLLGRLVAVGGSDLHVKSGARPRVRLNGELVQLVEEPPVEVDGVEGFLQSTMHERTWQHFECHFEADFAYSVPGLGRFRANAFRQRGSVSVVFHHVRPGPPTVGDLRLPDAVRHLAEEQRGIVLVGGPAGSGRTATLAAIVDHINTARECHVVTVEDPIEVLHRDRLASITQREVGFDTDGFLGGLRAGLRQDADVIVVGELRDAATAAAMLDAAEAGHLVVATFGASDSADTVSRFVDLFPAEQHDQVRLALAALLRGTICQRLVPAAGGEGRVPAVEVMAVNARIRHHILDAERTSAIGEVVAADDYRGMQTFAQSLYSLLAAGAIDVEVAMAAAPNPHELRLMLQRDGMGRDLLGPLISPGRT